jgi:hypothetical protein
MYCFTVFSTYVNFGASTVALKIKCLLCITHKIIRLRLFTRTVPENYSVSALGSFSGLKYHFT